MQAMTMNLTDEDIEQLAIWFASLLSSAPSSAPGKVSFH